VNGLPETEGKMPPLDELMQLYCKSVGRPYPILPWRVAVSFAHFRVGTAFKVIFKELMTILEQLAVIIQGIAARVLLKQATSEEAQQVAKGFKPLGRLAEAAAKKYDTTEAGEVHIARAEEAIARVKGDAKAKL
jgi:hypothetical protein